LISTKEPPEKSEDAPSELISGFSHLIPVTIQNTVGRRQQCCTNGEGRSLKRGRPDFSQHTFPSISCTHRLCGTFGGEGGPLKIRPSPPDYPQETPCSHLMTSPQHGKMGKSRRTMFSRLAPVRQTGQVTSEAISLTCPGSVSSLTSLCVERAKVAGCKGLIPTKEPPEKSEDAPSELISSSPL